MLRNLAIAALGSALFTATLALGVVGGGRDSAAALTNCATTSEALTDAELAVVDALNAYRQQNGLAPVKVSASLSRAAAFITEDMLVKGYWSHFEPGGRDPFQRAVDCGYPNKGVGENLARASGGAGVVALWKTSPGHNENMLKSQWKVAGVAGAGTYWALVLGATDDSGAPAPTASGPTNTPTPSPTPTATPTPGPKDPSLFPIRRALLQMVASE